MDKPIALGADHGGYKLKQAIKKHLQDKGVNVIDFGAFTEESIDYPDVARAACEAIQGGQCELGILCCGTGIGIGMAANKMHGIRACSCSESFSAKYTRLHNNANVLCLGGRVIGEGIALELTDLFLSTDFEGGRHQSRIDKISDLEKLQ